MEAPRIFAALRYQDPDPIIRWLCDTVGFTLNSSHSEDGTLVHAELAYGSSMIMLGAARESAHDAMLGTPGGGAIVLYLAVDDVDALFARVKAAGTTILEEPTDRDYGSREFTCRDAEGAVWTFGTYWPKPET